MHRRSFKQRLLLIQLLTTGIALIIALIAIGLLQRDRMLREVDEQLRGLASVLSEGLNYSLAFGDDISAHQHTDHTNHEKSRC